MYRFVRTFQTKQDTKEKEFSIQSTLTLIPELDKQEQLGKVLSGQPL